MLSFVVCFVKDLPLFGLEFAWFDRVELPKVSFRNDDVLSGIGFARAAFQASLYFCYAYLFMFRLVFSSDVSTTYAILAPLV